MPDPEGCLAGGSRFQGRARDGAAQGHAVAAPHRDYYYYYYKSYDDGFEFPCLMSHWRTWSTFTTLRAEIGMTIQGFSVT